MQKLEYIQLIASLRKILSASRSKEDILNDFDFMLLTSIGGCIFSGNLTSIRRNVKFQLEALPAFSQLGELFCECFNNALSLSV